MYLQEKLKTVLKGILLGLEVYLTTNVIIGLPQLFSKRIKDKQHLQQVILEEADKLGIGNQRNIGIIDHSENIWKRKMTPAYCYSDSYCNGIVIRDKLGMTRGVIRHELAHIANGDTITKSGIKN
ncbi:MAG: hypothetical protein AABX11_03955 [Nanoarchaeota archaeon]